MSKVSTFGTNYISARACAREDCFYEKFRKCDKGDVHTPVRAMQT